MSGVFHQRSHLLHAHFNFLHGIFLVGTSAKKLLKDFLLVNAPVLLTSHKRVSETTVTNLVDTKSCSIITELIS